MMVKTPEQEQQSNAAMIKIWMELYKFKVQTPINYPSASAVYRRGITDFCRLFNPERRTALWMFKTKEAQTKFSSQFMNGPTTYG